MKFIYIDESGSRDQGDVFVTFGLMVDAYKLRKKTADFDQRLEALFAKHPGNRADFKTSRFINGKGGWREIDATERKAFLKSVCELAVENGGKIFGLGLSFTAFDAASAVGHVQPPIAQSAPHPGTDRRNRLRHYPRTLPHCGVTPWPRILRSTSYRLARLAEAEGPP